MPPTKQIPGLVRFLLDHANHRSIYFIHKDIHGLPPASFQGRVDIITCNPPYIPLASRASLDRSVTKYEPHEALFVPSKHGDDYYYALLSIANRWETPAVIMEVGDFEQAKRVKTLFERHYWTSSIWLDSAGKGRVVVAVKSERWTFLLPQPDYAAPLDLSPFPLQERRRKGMPGSILSAFRRPKIVVRELPSRCVKRDKERLDSVEEGESTLSESLKTDVKEDQNMGSMEDLEDMKISK